MKKSELISKIDVEKMSEELGVCEESIKLALVGPSQKVEMVSVEAITSLIEARKLYRQAKSRPRKIAIAKKAIGLCKDLRDLETYKKIVFDSDVFDHVTLEGKFAECFRTIARVAIKNANSFKEIHDVWVKLDDHYVVVEDLEAYEKMKSLALSTDTWEVFETFFEDNEMGILIEGSDHYEILVLVSENSTPLSAKKALEWFGSFSWNGEDDAYPVQLLIKRASELYLK